MNKKHLIFGLVMLSLTILTLSVITSCKKDSDEEVIKGCMDPNSITYNPSATEDDGSCMQPEVKQRAIFLDFTGTWCTYCGQWGIPYFETGITNRPNEVVPLGVHTGSDPMTNPTSTALAGTYNLTGVPTLIVGNQPKVSSVNAIYNAISATNANPPIANAIGLMTVSGTTITIKTQTKFFSAASGDFYLATYLVENGFVYNQTGSATNPVTHKHILRGVAAGNEHGEIISTGSAAAGKIINKDYTVTAGSAWNMANVYIALVLWKKDGSTWTFINAWQSIAN